MNLVSLESGIDTELWRFTLLALEERTEDLAVPAENLIELAEGLGLRVTRGTDDTPHLRPMTLAENRAAIEGCLRWLPRECAEQFRARIANLNRTRGVATR